MRRKNQSVRIIDQRISCNAGLFLIGSGKSAIDHKHFSVTFDRAFSRNHFHRHMPVNDMCTLFGQSKFFQNHIDYFFVFKQIIIWVFLFFMRLFFSKEITFKCCHFIFSKQWGIFTQPDIPHHVLSPLFFLLI